MTTEGRNEQALAGVELAGRLGVRVPVLQAIAAVLTGRLEPRRAAALIGDTVAEAE